MTRRKIVRHHFPDEEPDVDELPIDWFHEMILMDDTCMRCGRTGHKGVDCPDVQPYILKKPGI